MGPKAASGLPEEEVIATSLHPTYYVDPGAVVLCRRCYMWMTLSSLALRVCVCLVCLTAFGDWWRHLCRRVRRWKAVVAAPKAVKKRQKADAFVQRACARSAGC